MSNHIKLEEITKNDIYVNESDTTEKTTVINEDIDFSSLSWVNMVEEELGNSLEDKLLVCSNEVNDSNKSESSTAENTPSLEVSGSCNDSLLSATSFSQSLPNDSTDNLKILQELAELSECDIENIKTIKYNNVSDIVLLHYQIQVCNYLKKMIKKCAHIDYYYTMKDDICEKLEWLTGASKYLSNKIGLTMYNHACNNHINKNVIPRSSYKFCNYNYECEFNYNLKKTKGCFAQHYVHNIIYADIVALEKFIDNNINMDSDGIEQIKKSITTMLFVITHMHDELLNSCIYRDKISIDENHVDRTPVKSRRKRIYKNTRSKKVHQAI